MRAVYYPSLQEEVQSYILREGPFHHLKNVIRIREGEEILLLNGRGLKAFGEVVEINKKDIVCEIKQYRRELDNRIFDVAYCITKRESFDLAVKLAVELNVKNFYPLISQFSQNYKLKESRYNALIQSALEQSNASYKLNLHLPLEFTDFFRQHCDKYKHIHIFDLVADNNISTTPTALEQDLIVIGPEGGF
jgi:16S rRNA (uracil1498-N3)-methyltransferase